MLVGDISEENALKLYHIQGISSTITYSIFINRDMKVSALKGNTFVLLCGDIIGFNWKLRKFSELHEMIDKAASFPTEFHNELIRFTF